ncbi:uncharacterized protein BJ171DRAFT_638161 [Polychytrium aggregatum]|uniref:uncharacterized protein n=1 Tax=Polychytrium aggregatum TaxID=110093 RepID=UPI0022FF343D|nr:uncharacterized protein BJ171DRAFT_638161 [Polychytrium aggregatum]KAI9207503.1 hypothetical protein BJ171DRAFT_638161 [Polychytrium aggregatum]
MGILRLNRSNCTATTGPSIAIPSRSRANCPANEAALLIAGWLADWLGGCTAKLATVQAASDTCISEQILAFRSAGETRPQASSQSPPLPSCCPPDRIQHGPTGSSQARPHPENQAGVRCRESPLTTTRLHLHLHLHLHSLPHQAGQVHRRIPMRSLSGKRNPLHLLHSSEETRTAEDSPSPSCRRLVQLVDQRDGLQFAGYQSPSIRVFDAALADWLAQDAVAAPDRSTPFGHDGAAADGQACAARTTSASGADQHQHQHQHRIGIDIGLLWQNEYWWEWSRARPATRQCSWGQLPWAEPPSSSVPRSARGAIDIDSDIACRPTGKPEAPTSEVLPFPLNATGQITGMFFEHLGLTMDFVDPAAFRAELARERYSEVQTILDRATAGGLDDDSQEETETEDGIVDLDGVAVSVIGREPIDSRNVLDCLSHKPTHRIPRPLGPRPHRKALADQCRIYTQRLHDHPCLQVLQAVVIICGTSLSTGSGASTGHTYYTGLAWNMAQDLGLHLSLDSHGSWTAPGPHHTGSALSHPSETPLPQAPTASASSQSARPNPECQSLSIPMARSGTTSRVSSELRYRRMTLLALILFDRLGALMAGRCPVIPDDGWDSSFLLDGFDSLYEDMCIYVHLAHISGRLSSLMVWVPPRSLSVCGQWWSSLSPEHQQSPKGALGLHHHLHSYFHSLNIIAQRLASTALAGRSHGQPLHRTNSDTTPLNSHPKQTNADPGLLVHPHPHPHPRHHSGRGEAAKGGMFESRSSPLPQTVSGSSPVAGEPDTCKAPASLHNRPTATAIIHSSVADRRSLELDAGDLLENRLATPTSASSEERAESVETHANSASRSSVDAIGDQTTGSSTLSSNETHPSTRASVSVNHTSALESAKYILSCVGIGSASASSGLGLFDSDRTLQENMPSGPSSLLLPGMSYFVMTAATVYLDTLGHSSDRNLALSVLDCILDYLDQAHHRGETYARLIRATIENAHRSPCPPTNGGDAGASVSPGTRTPLWPGGLAMTSADEPGIGAASSAHARPTLSPTASRPRPAAHILDIAASVAAELPPSGCHDAAGLQMPLTGSAVGVSDAHPRGHLDEFVWLLPGHSTLPTIGAVLSAPDSNQHVSPLGETLVLGRPSRLPAHGVSSPGTTPLFSTTMAARHGDISMNPLSIPAPTLGQYPTAAGPFPTASHSHSAHDSLAWPASSLMAPTVAPDPVAVESITRHSRLHPHPYRRRSHPIHSIEGQTPLQHTQHTQHHSQHIQHHSHPAQHQLHPYQPQPRQSIHDPGINSNSLLNAGSVCAGDQTNGFFFKAAHSFDQMHHWLSGSFPSDPPGFGHDLSEAYPPNHLALFQHLSNTTRATGSSRLSAAIDTTAARLAGHGGFLVPPLASDHVSKPGISSISSSTPARVLTPLIPMGVSTPSNANPLAAQAPHHLKSSPILSNATTGTNQVGPSRNWNKMPGAVRLSNYSSSHIGAESVPGSTFAGDASSMEVDEVLGGGDDRIHIDPRSTPDSSRHSLSTIPGAPAAKTAVAAGMGSTMDATDDIGSRQDSTQQPSLKDAANVDTNLVGQMPAINLPQGLQTPVSSGLVDRIPDKVNGHGADSAVVPASHDSTILMQTNRETGPSNKPTGLCYSEHPSVFDVAAAGSAVDLGSLMSMAMADWDPSVVDDTDMPSGWSTIKTTLPDDRL